jgi:hypothetical protein
MQEPSESDGMAFQVKVDASGFIAQRRELEQRSIPFALASALTGVAQDAQAEVKRNVRGAFKLRNSWTEQGIRIKPARSNEYPIQADVHTDTANRSTGAPDYLGRQESGGEKVQHAGGEFIAIPTKYLRQFAPTTIPNELRPRNLLGAADGRFLYTGRKGQQVNGRQRVVRGFVFFKQKMKDGRWAILARVASDKRARDVIPFYILVPSARVPESNMHMVDTVTRVALDRFERQWDVAWQRIYRNGIRT